MNGSPAKPWEESPSTTPTEPPARPSAPYSAQNIANTSLTYPSRFSSPYASTYNSPYSTYGNRYYSDYSSPYGGYSSGYGTGYGGYGSAYGTGYGGYGMNRQPPAPPQLGEEYMSAFQVLEQVVQSFGGLASLLDSTLMAVHSSFMAMVGLADHYGHLRQLAVDFISVFSVFRLFSNVFGKSGTGGELSTASFDKFQSESQRKYSRKPILVFLLVFFGLPLILTRILKHLKPRTINDGTSNTVETGSGKNVTFARALYDFTAQSPEEISFNRGDLLAVIASTDSNGQSSPWWRGKLRHGNVGYFPANYVEVIVKKEKTPDSLKEEEKEE